MTEDTEPNADAAPGQPTSNPLTRKKGTFQTRMVKRPADGFLHA